MRAMGGAMGAMGPRDERLLKQAAEMAGMGGVLVSMGLAAACWSVCLCKDENWWCVPLFLLGLVLALWGMCKVADSRRLRCRVMAAMEMSRSGLPF